MGIEEFLLDREHKKGIEKGIEKGVKKNQIEIVKSLHDDGFDVDRIAKITKLSEAEVESILKKKKKQ